MIRLLLGHKDINVELKTGDGFTALYKAAFFGHLGSVRLLVKVWEILKQLILIEKYKRIILRKSQENWLHFAEILSFFPKSFYVTKSLIIE